MISKANIAIIDGIFNRLDDHTEYATRLTILEKKCEKKHE